jgi:hypothetical protein
MTATAPPESDRRILPWPVLAVAILAALIAYAVAPWFDASPVPVQMVLDAPADTPLRISWEEDRSSAVPLIRQRDDVPPSEVGSAAGALWLAELPPRPSYQLAILFDAPVAGVVLRELTLVNVRTLDLPILRLNAGELAAQLQPESVRLTAGTGGIVLDSAASGSVSLPARIPCTNRPLGGVFVVLWCVVTATFLLAGLFGRACLHEALAPRPIGASLDPARSAPSSLVPIWLAVGLGFVLHLGVAASIPALYNAFDPLAYFHKAVWLVERGTYITNTPSWEMDRLPGYPLFLAACLTLFGYQLQLVVLTQGLLLTLALAALAVSLRHWVRPLFGGVAVLLLLASPVSMQHTLSIGTEGLFATCAILATAAFFEHLAAARRGSAGWMTVCGLAISAATLIRPNGIVLLAMPLLAWAPRALRGALIPGGWSQKLRTLAGGLWPYAIPVALLVVVLGGWTVRNGWQHGLLAPSSMVGVSIVEGQLQAGTFDARSLDGVRLYEAFVRDRQSERYGYSGWNIRRSLGRQLSEGGTHFLPGHIATLDREMKAIGARSGALAPWPLRMAGLLRSFVRGFVLPASRSYTRNTIWTSPYFYGNHPDARAAWRRFCREEAIARLGKPLPLLDLEDETPTTGWAVDYLRWPDGWHRWAYRGFLIASLILLPIMLWRGALLLTVPILVFLANLTLNTWLLNMQGRYIMPLEFAVVFQTAIGLDLLLRGRLRQGWNDPAASAPPAAAIEPAGAPARIGIAA